MSQTLSPLAPNAAFAELASPEQQATTIAALRDNGFTVEQVQTAADARNALFAWLRDHAAGKTVFDSSSKTLQQIGVDPDALGAAGLSPLRAQLQELDYATQGDERRRMMASPDIIVGSAHAITASGQIVTASASGSQIGAYASGAGEVLLVVGAQKLVRTLDDAFTRIREYTYPLEDARLREVYGIPSTLAKWLILDREIVPGRVTVILVNENLGF